MGVTVKVCSLGQQGPEHCRTQEFEKSEIYIGRDGSNDLMIESPHVSSSHLLIRLQEDPAGGSLNVFASDLGSTNGTIVSGQFLKPHEERRISPGERLVVATFVLEVEISSNFVEKLKRVGTSHGAIIPASLQAALLSDCEEMELPNNLPSASGRYAAVPARPDLHATLMLIGENGAHDVPAGGIRVDAGELGITDTDSQGRFSFGDVQPGASVTFRFYFQGMSYCCTCSL